MLHPVCTRAQPLLAALARSTALRRLCNRGRPPIRDKSSSEDQIDAAGIIGRLTRRLTGSPALSDLASRVVEVRWFDRALALAARLFIAVIPLALVISALSPDDVSFAERLDSSLGLRGAGESAARALFAAPETIRSSVTIFSVLVVAYALSSYCGELQRMYRACWRLDRVGPDGLVGDVRRRAIWVAAFALFVAVSSLLSDADPQAGAASAAVDVGRTALAVGFFGWTPHLLLDRRVPTRRLWPTALLSAVALGAITAAAPLYVPQAASSYTKTYGLIGFIFTFFSYLFAQAFLVTGAGIIGAWIGDRAAWKPASSTRDAA